MRDQRPSETLNWFEGADVLAPGPGRWITLPVEVDVGVGVGVGEGEVLW